MPHRTMVMRKTLHLSHCLVSFPVPSAFTGSFVFLRYSSARTAVDALRFSSSAAGCYPLRRHGGFGEVGTDSPFPELKKRTFTRVSAASWLSGFGTKKGKAPLPEIVKAGDPVLHEPAGEVPVQEIGSEKIQKVIDDMIACMRKVPGVGLAAPQIGVPLKVGPLLLRFPFWRRDAFHVVKLFFSFSSNCSIVKLQSVCPHSSYLIFAFSSHFFISRSWVIWLS